MEIVDAVGFKQTRGGQSSAATAGQCEGATEAPAAIPAVPAIPADAMFVIAVLNGEQGADHERRRYRRHAHVAPAELEVIGDASPPRRTLYTRDATLRIWLDGEMLMLRGYILRCREVLPGWFEGAALLYVEEPRLETRQET